MSDKEKTTVTTVDCNRPSCNLHEHITDATEAQLLALLTLTSQHRQDHPGHEVSLMHNVNPQR